MNDKVFCLVSEDEYDIDDFLISKPTVTVIECSERYLYERRGIDSANFCMEHPCFEVTALAMKKLLRDGYVRISQEAYRKKYFHMSKAAYRKKYY